MRRGQTVVGNSESGHRDVSNCLALKTCWILYLVQSAICCTWSQKSEPSFEWVFLRDPAERKTRMSQHPADAKGGSQSLLLLTYATLNNAPFQMVDPVNPRLPLAPHSQHARSACGTELESPSLAQTAWQDTTDTDMSYNLGWSNHYSNKIRGTKKTKVSQSLLHNKNVNVEFIAVWEWQKTLFIFSDNDVYILDT